jgi:phosphate transport system protein
MASLDEPAMSVTRSSLTEALHESEAAILDALVLVRRLLARAVEAAIACDPARALAVNVDAAELAGRYREIHQALLRVLARQAPVAGDLRVTIAMLYANDRVERMGRQCSSIAVMCSALPPGSASARQLKCLEEMAELVDRQLAHSARTFAERDVSRALALRDGDSPINEHNRRCFSLALEDGRDSVSREAALFVALMARAIERIGDNAVDIGRQAVFIKTGRFHAPA